LLRGSIGALPWPGNSADNERNVAELRLRVPTLQLETALAEARSRPLDAVLLEAFQAAELATTSTVQPAPQPNPVAGPRPDEPAPPHERR
jgi:hypothetical protein